ncbi:MAG TPA: hypothetical protein PL124_09670 [Candidatus Cloacimonadota bacterium]|nr:hypothetical protein [Candidatus Cloacimonadota bacterium]HPS39667.1 hypothetical protein [Candidatus Cloacimonadota bacterium]
MAKKYFNLIFYRAAGAVISSATKGGSYPNYTISGWTLVPGGIADKAKIGLADDGKDGMGDGTEYTSGEKEAVEIIVKNFTAANHASIRSAFLNVKVDVLMMDSEQPGTAYVAHGIVLYPKPDINGGEEPMITISGERKVGAGLSLFAPITVS